MAARGQEHGNFAITRWSAVVSLQGSDPLAARGALNWLCEAYWQPLVEHARRRGHQQHEAQDLVQDFFMRLLEKRDLQADPARGRFRSYLLGALEHFMANQRERMRAAKRGGGQVPAALDERLVATDSSPERAFTRDWATTLLARTLEQLEGEFQAPRRAEQFAACKPFLTGDGKADSYAAIGIQLGMSEGAVKVAVHRLRSRYRELLRLEVAQTVEDPAAIDDELADLLGALRS